jgi:hypothetical protein
MYNVAVINESTVVSDAEVHAATAALQVQMTRDFASIWGLSVSLAFIPTGTKAPSNFWWLTILDNSDQAGALGYHDLTTTGLPIGKVFAKTDQQYGLSWTVTASHELLEMAVDPYINLTVFNQTGETKGMLYAYEVGDAVEDDRFGYSINGVLVSDFVTPAWFEGWRRPKSARFDFGNHLTAPLQLLNGGYIGAFNVAGGSGWTQLTAEAETIQQRPAIGSRRERRAIGPERWILSTV